MLGTLALGAAAVLGLAVGPADLAALWRSDPSAAELARTVLIELRAPRVAMAALAGASLAASGCVMQALLRNPLAEPGLLGLSAGAACGAAAAMALLPLAWAALSVPLLALAGALGVAWLVIALGSREGTPRVAGMLLAGLAINAIAGALLGLLLQLADEPALRGITFWLFGSVGKARWPQIALGALPMLAAIAVPLLLARKIDALMLGDEVAFHLGIDAQGLQRLLLASVVLGTATAVALTGIIGFVGLLVPHFVRGVAGVRARVAIPLSALYGAALLVAADVAGRLMAAPAELPVGVLTALLGGPFFLLLLLRQPETLADP